MKQPIQWSKLVAAGSVLVVVGLVALIIGDQRKTDERLGIPALSGVRSAADDGPGILVFCAAGLREPVEAAAKEYQAKYGKQIQLQFGGSETLLANIGLTHKGDLFIPADDSYVDSARGQNLVAETIPLASMTPVVIVKPGNPKSIHSLNDLLRPDVAVSLANPDATAVGRVTRDALGPEKQYDLLQAHAKVIKTTVNDVATDVKVGAVDAGIVWDATAQQLGSRGQSMAVQAIHLPELDKVAGHVSVCVLTTSPDDRATDALRFARFLGARDRGLLKFAAAGFRPALGDQWAETPHLLLYGGAMLRPAIDQTVTDFARREGCQIDTVYNGCGILVGQMKLGQRPDAYFSCDRGFMDKVQDLFTDEVNVSMNQLVILVPKSNPHNITTLHDLTKPGLRLGIGNEKQGALGALTANTLRQSGDEASVLKNVAVESPTGDLLVNQLLAGSLDAVIVYVSNAVGHPDKLVAMKIELPSAYAIQPVARGRESKFPNLVSRLMKRLVSAESEKRFTENGFHWEIGKPVPLVGMEYSDQKSAGGGAVAIPAVSAGIR